MKKEMENILEEDVVAWFPAISSIEDEVIRNGCIKSFIKAFKKGGWNKETVESCPVSITKVKNQALNNQIEHTNIVTKLAVSMYQMLEEAYSNDSQLKDIIMAGALLHDVGKFTEFKHFETGVGYSETADLMRHPLGGAIIASEAGLPDSVVHIIATHSFEGQNSFESTASAIVKYADEIAFKYIRAF